MAISGKARDIICKMINFAIIGTSWITESFIKCAEASKAWKIVAVYSRKEETAKEFGARYNVSKTFTDLEALAKDGSVQAVYIASPNSLHYEHATIMLRGKKHVIAEKPLASNMQELNELFKTSKENGVFLIEAYRHIQEKNFKILKRNLDRLGPIYGASLNYASYSSRYNNVLAGENPNVFSLEFSGGSLTDLGVYPISAAVALFGKPVSQTYKPVLTPAGGDAGGFIQLNYDKFAVSLNASKCYTSRAPSEVYGQNGTMVMNAITDISHVTYLDAKTKKEEELGEGKEDLNMLEEAEEFARIIGNADQKAAKDLEDISRIVVGITEDLRKQNDLIFGTEK